MADVGKFFGSLFGTAAGSAASAAVAPAAGIVDGAQKIIGMFKLDPTVKAQLQAQLVAENVDMEKTELAAQLAAMQGQLDANKVEAGNSSVWVSGWRPAVGWICAFALGYQFIVQPLLGALLIAIHHPPMQPLPMLDTGTLVAGLLAPLLGLGGLRTLEKVKAVPGSDQLN